MREIKIARNELIVLEEIVDNINKNPSYLTDTGSFASSDIEENYPLIRKLLRWGNKPDLIGDNFSAVHSTLSDDSPNQMKRFLSQNLNTITKLIGEYRKAHGISVN